MSAKRRGRENEGTVVARGGGRARALSLDLLLDSFWLFLPLPGQPVASRLPPSSRLIFAALRSLSLHAHPPRNDLPGIDVLQRSALTSALPRAESSEARDDSGDESGDDASEVLAPAPPAAAPPPKTLVFDSTLSSERRPSTRPSDVAGEGSAFSTVVASGKVLECRS